MYQRHRRSLLCARRVAEQHERELDNVFHRRPLLIGNCVLLFGRKNAFFPLHALVGPDWPCMLGTNLLIVVPSVLFLVKVAAALSPVVVAIGTVSLSVLVAVFLATACSDPGIVFSSPSETADEEKAEVSSEMTMLKCGQCNLRRPSTACHCYECDVCVDRLDHHCPWTGKCIGARNLRLFQGFLWALAVHITLVVACCVYAWATDVNTFNWT